MTALAPPPRTAAPVPPHATAPVAPMRATGNPALWHAGATAIIWLTSLFVVALWVAGGGVPATLGLTAETLTTLGRLTGLVSANLLLYQVLLMARVPVFERGFGRDAITRMHRFVGFWSFWLLVAHIGLLVAGYAASSGINPIAQLWEFIWEYPGMLLATAGTLLILLVVVTSIRRARRRLRYESWHLLHLYAYLGVGPRPPPPAVDGRGLPVLPARHGVLVDAVGDRGGVGARVPDRAAARAVGAPRHPRDRRRARRRPRRDRAACRGARCIG